jgi:hypothetical protein
MATVTVTKQFKENFEVWASNAIGCGDFTQADMDELKAMLRKEFQPGPDPFRDGDGRVDDYEQRIKIWTIFFSEKAEELSLKRKAA